MGEITRDIDNFNFAALAFELTDRCPITCNSCLRSCLPTNNRVMQFEQIRYILDQCVTGHSFREVGFSGGEVFLYPDLLMRASEYIHEKMGASIVAATNGFWAKNRSEARKRLKPLAALGLRSILVSVDDFHQKFVKPAFIEACVHEARALDIAVTLQVIETKNSRHVDEFKELFRFDKDDDKIEWMSNPCDPVGRAGVMVPGEEFERGQLCERTVCSVFRLLSVRLDGGVVICCGSGAEAGGMVIGNAFEEPLKDIIERAHFSPLMNSLALYGGPQYLIEVLKQNGVADKINKKYTSACEACYQIFSCAETMDALSSALEPERFGIYAERLAWQARLVQHLRNQKAAGRMKRLS
jgi:MoaA/NifB/PqqE/SkfB family radical SAM enzyme